MSLDDLIQDKQPDKQGFSVSEMVKNIPQSALGLGKSMTTAVTHPVSTGLGLVKTAAGGVESATGLGKEPSDLEAWDNFKEVMKSRYGGIQNVKNTIQKDPVGFAADVAGVLSGVSSGLKVASMPRAAEAVSTASRAIDPTLAATKAAGATIKGAGNILAGVTGMTTGTGMGVTQRALEQTLQNPAFRQAYTGATKPTDIVDHLMQGLQNFKSAKNAEFETELSKVKNLPQQLDITPIKQHFENLLKGAKVDIVPQTGLTENQRIAQEFFGQPTKNVLDFSNSNFRNTTPALTGQLSKVYDTLQDWEKNPQNLTPDGVHTLKQIIGNSYHDGQKTTPFIASTYDKTNKLLQDAVPGYKQMNDKYSKQMRLVDEIEKDFSTEGLSDDTKFRKLNQALRETFGLRKEILQTLQAGGHSGDILSEIAGNQLSQIAPRGIVGGVVGGLGALNFAHKLTSGQIASPSYIASLATLSPKVMGGFLGTLGVPMKYINQTVNYIKNSPATRQAAFQVGRLQSQENR